MTRTYWLAEPLNTHDGQFIARRKITCRVVGEWASGSKIWMDEAGEQYYCFRLLGIYYFAHV